MREGRHVPKTKEDFFLRLTAVQLVCCGLVLLLIFAAMKRGGDLFDAMKTEFLALTEKNFDPGGFNFFDFGSADEKKQNGAPAANAENAAAPEPSEPTETPPESSPPLPESETGAWAGGADLSADEAEGQLSFAFYTAGTEVVLPVNGVQTSPFGERVHPIYGTVGFHSGKDIGAPEGTPVHAAMDGVVIGVGVGESSGNYVKLRHENGVDTLYCHLYAANVEEGVAVRRGDVIGFVGQTGLATGPHLHFEVHMDGVKRDPDFLLEGAAVVS